MHQQRHAILRIVAALSIANLAIWGQGQELPKSDQVKTIEMFRVPRYCEGVCFDHDGNGYISWGKMATSRGARRLPDLRSMARIRSGRKPVRPMATKFWLTARTWFAMPASTRCCICRA